MHRYVVCQGFRNGAGVIQQYLYAVNMHMNTLKLSRKARSDVVEVRCWLHVAIAVSAAEF